MAHGRRRGRVKGEVCVKAAFTTYEAARAALKELPDDEGRIYRGKHCCGYYHYTRYSEAEFSQRMAMKFLEGGEDHGKAATSPVGAVPGCWIPQPRRGDGGPGEAPLWSEWSSRPAPESGAIAG